MGFRTSEMNKFVSLVRNGITIPIARETKQGDTPMPKHDLTRAGFPSTLNATLEAAESSHAIEVAAWETYKHLYMMLQNSMALRVRPAVEWIAQNQGHNKAIRYCHEVLPDCIERTLLIHNLIKTDPTNKEE